MNQLFRKVLLSTVVCSFSVMSIGQVAYMSGSTLVDKKNRISSELIWKESVRSNANTITSIKAEKNDQYSDLMFLKPILTHKRIVSLGEASHGTSEYNSMKVRLVKFLHEELGYDVIAFESNLADTTAAYAQIHNTTPEELMKSSVYGVWQVEENLPLFEYIAQQSNTDHPLILTGFDSQGTSESFIKFVEAWFAKVDKNKATAFAQTERWYLKLNMVNKVDDFNIQKKKIKEKYITLQKFVRDNKAELSRNQKEQLNLISLVDRVLQNRLDMLDNYHPHIVNLLAGVDPEKHLKLGSYERDRVMADNVEWLAETVYPEEKIILWGHNYHIRKNNSTMITEHNGYDYDNNPYPTVGEMLPYSLKQAGYVIGLYAYEGSAYKNNGEEEQVQPHKKGSLEDIVGTEMGPARFINMKDEELSPTTEWMYTPRIAKAWGVLDEKMIPRDQYDGILLIHKIHPSNH
ncbi:erythromycin esterase family protein [Paenibacillus amylolyticus]|uniref:erythromycin esterase family protein n=1 Tax=Paenibacillus amylolyticus TaxID=1451 RepID=UPI00201E45C8|nr:erythromycin esterase family protein [Paenibacillus amylolyticus]MCL6658436.1 erythromycin esterase family protein [Paenibacillus amylolyticus]